MLSRPQPGGVILGHYVRIRRGWRDLRDASTRRVDYSMVHRSESRLSVGIEVQATRGLLRWSMFYAYGVFSSHPLRPDVVLKVDARQNQCIVYEV